MPLAPKTPANGQESAFLSVLTVASNPAFERRGADPDPRQKERNSLMAHTTAHTAESVRAYLKREDVSGDIFIERALVALYERQTADEQASGDTSHKNGKGFNCFDAELGSSFAKQIVEQKELVRAYNNPEGKRLSPKQRAVARKMLIKYAGQLAGIANAKAGTPTTTAVPTTVAASPTSEEWVVSVSEEDYIAAEMAGREDN